jgi:hypothetical protein
MSEQIKISRFDQVRLLSTKNINYLSAPPKTQVNPSGIWSVCAVVGNDLLLVKNNTIIKAPPGNVLKIADYDITRLTSILGRLSRVQETSQKDTTNPTNE